MNTLHGSDCKEVQPFNKTATSNKKRTMFNSNSTLLQNQAVVEAVMANSIVALLATKFDQLHLSAESYPGDKFAKCAAKRELIDALADIDIYVLH